MSYLKRGTKASLNSPFDKLNPCSSSTMALSLLDGHNVFICLITCLTDMGRALSICFDLSCSPWAFFNFASFIKVCFHLYQG